MHKAHSLTHARTEKGMDVNNNLSLVLFLVIILLIFQSMQGDIVCTF